MRLTVLFEPRPWIKRRACSRSRTVAPVLHYFRVLRGVLRHHQLIYWYFDPEIFLPVMLYQSFVWNSLCPRHIRSTHNRVRALGCLSIDPQPHNIISTSFEKTCMRQFHTFPWMNDVWLTPNTDLYHDQGLFKRINAQSRDPSRLTGIFFFGCPKKYHLHI